MEHLAKSPFWRTIAVALVAALAWVGWAVSGERTILPVAKAGGVYTSGGVTYTTDETGGVLYGWTQDGWAERWSWDTGQVTRKAMVRLVVPAGGLPPAPGGTPGGRDGR